MRRAGGIAVLVCLSPGLALAHGATANSSFWSPEPWVAVPMLAALIIFTAGLIRLARRANAGAPQLRRQAAWFYLGLAALAGAALSPLHMAGRRSFTAHMIEHELLMLVVAPLLVAARPLAVMIWAFPLPARRALGGVSHAPLIAPVWRRLTDPAWATMLQAAALWVWHAPSLFDRALIYEGWHVAQHVSFLATALLFWTCVLDRRRGVGQAALCLFLTSLVSGALGAAMAVSESPWYRGYAALGLTPNGLTPAEDQQLAGVLMWVPGGMVHALAALVLLSSVLRTRPGRRDAPQT